MEVKAERIGTTLVLAPIGHIETVGAGEFQRYIDEEIEGTEERVILDMAGVPTVSSAALRGVLLAARQVEDRGATLTICSLTAPVRDVFETVGFDRLFTVTDSRDAALNR